jgi:hypothetical protein
MVGLGPVAVLGCAFAGGRGRWRISAFDLVCGALSLSALVLWLLSGDGDVGIALSIVADVCASVPTVRKMYRSPQTESRTAYGCAAVSAGITLLTVDRLAFRYYAFPAYLLALCAMLLSLGRRGRVAAEEPR